MDAENETPKPKTLMQIELDAICAAIARNNGHKSAAAEELGISLKTLYNKLNQAELKQLRPAKIIPRRRE